MRLHALAPPEREKPEALVVSRKKRAVRPPQQAPAHAACPVPPAPAGPAKPVQAADTEEGGGLSVFWRVFGGTLLSITAMLAVTAHQSISGALGTLRGDLAHLNTEMRKDLASLGESYGDLVKKDEVDARARTVWDALNDLRGDKAELTALQQRCDVLTERFKAGQQERRRLAQEARGLREQQAAGDERQELVRQVRELRERVARLQGRGPARAAVRPTMLPAERDEP
jgi:hypothetical protein